MGANSKAAAHDEDEEEKENTQCKPGLEGGDTFQEHHSSVISHSEEKKNPESSTVVRMLDSIAFIKTF